jgi:superfamily II DNA or RNA helicase
VTVSSFRTSLGKLLGGFPEPQVQLLNLQPLLPSGRYKDYSTLLLASTFSGAGDDRITGSLALEVPQATVRGEYSELCSSLALTEVLFLELLPLSEFPVKAIIAETSQNLLEPLREFNIGGKSYKKKDATLFGGDQDLPPTPSIPGKSKAYAVEKRGRVTTENRMTVWDLILPMLHPPLDTEFPVQVDLPYSLRLYQYPGVNFLANSTSALLADEMGTGKTVMAAVAMRLLFQQGEVIRALIICSRHILAHWDSHVSQWAPILTRTVVRGTPAERCVDWSYPAHVYITTPDCFRKDVLPTSDSGTGEAAISRRELGKINLILIDDVSAIKNPTNKISRALRLASPKFRWVLNGTPVENELEDLVGIFGFLKPGYLSAVGLTPSRAKELIEPYFLRRTKKQLKKDGGLQIPNKEKQEFWLELDSNQKKVYEEVLGRGVSEMKRDGQLSSRMHIFALITKLKQLCNFAPGMKDSPKMQHTRDLVDTIVRNDEKVVVFTQYVKEGVEKLISGLEEFGPVAYYGEMSDVAQARSLRQFLQDTDKSVFVANFKSGGRGLDGLQNIASYVIHFDHWWNPVTMYQAEDRVHRSLNQELASRLAPVGGFATEDERPSVNVYSLWMSDTIDDRIYQVLERKGLLHEEVIEGLSESDIDGKISSEEWMEILGLQPIAQKAVKRDSISSHQNIKEILDELQEIAPLEFEVLTKRVFQKLGYPAVKTTRKSRDGGIDLVASRPIPGGREKVIVQCKTSDNTIGVNIGRELLGVVDHASFGRGYLVASGSISQECIQFCESTGRLSCIDGLQLAHYILQFDINIHDDTLSPEG